MKGGPVEFEVFLELDDWEDLLTFAVTLSV